MMARMPVVAARIVVRAIAVGAAGAKEAEGQRAVGGVAVAVPGSVAITRSVAIVVARITRISCVTGVVIDARIHGRRHGVPVWVIRNAGRQGESAEGGQTQKAKRWMHGSGLRRRVSG